MGPCGSVWTDIKTGRSPMAQDHFQTPPDPQRAIHIKQIQKKVLKCVPNQPSMQELTCFASGSVSFNYLKQSGN